MTRSAVASKRRWPSLARASTVQAADCPAGLHLHVEINDAFDERAAVSEGAYVLRTNIEDWSDKQLWRAYIQFTQAEATCRIHKDQLRVSRLQTTDSQSLSPVSAYCRHGRCLTAAAESSTPTARIGLLR